MRVKEIHLVLSDVCNISCKYCTVDKYYGSEQSKIDKKALKVSREFVDKARTEGVRFDRVSIHGAEPTTVSASVLAECINMVTNVTDEISLQTNGVRLGDGRYSRNFYSKIKEFYKLGISVSLDGPKVIHDNSRDCSYNKAWKAVEVAISELGTCGIVAVIGNHTIEHKAEFAEWAKKVGAEARIKLSLRTELGEGFTNKAEQVKLAKIVIDEGLYEYTELAQKRRAINAGNRCDTLFVGTDATMYACNKYVDKNTRVGDLNTFTFAEVKKKRELFFANVKTSEECTRCEYQNMCNSGCPLYRINDKAHECSIRKVLYSSNKYQLNNGEIGCFKSVVKSVKKAVKKVAKVATKAVKTAVSIVADINPLKFVAPGLVNKLESATHNIVDSVGSGDIGNVFRTFGKEVGGFVGGSIGEFISDSGNDIASTVDTVTGKYHERQEALEKAYAQYDASRLQYQKKYETAVNKYSEGLEALYERLESLIAFDHVFQLAAQNDIDAYGSFQDPSDSEMMKWLAKYEKMLSQFKQDFDFIISLSQGGIVERLVAGLLQIYGGIIHDMRKIADGEANSKTWKNLGQVAVAIVVVAFLIISGPGGWVGLALLVLSIVSTVMMLDGMYANGLVTSAVMGTLDYLFNDLLNLDDRVGSDFDKFNPNHADYQEMVGYIQIGIMVAQVILGMYSWITSPPAAPVEAASSATAESGEIAAGTEAAATTSKSGLIDQMQAFYVSNKDTFSTIYKVYSAASGVNDVVSANKAYEAAKEKLAEVKVQVDTIVENHVDKRMMGHYKDSAYFLNDQQEYIDRYIWSMTAENMYVDPYGTTPVANIRFTPDKDTRMMSFGYEDVFDESKMAGSANYFNNIIYGG